MGNKLQSGSKLPQEKIFKITLKKSLGAWGSSHFREILKTEVEALQGNLLPLQQGLRQSSHAITDRFSVIILAISDDLNFVHIKSGIFYSGIIAGCNCADDPTPVDTQNEYCEIILNICKSNAQTEIRLYDQETDTPPFEDCGKF
ncbi:MAG TPA: hypothetical protein ENI64_11705 [Gammaproteobacteria bacterium]|nr:hypothetical protein [Gammaproteobacteria bacterium]